MTSPVILSDDYILICHQLSSRRNLVAGWGVNGVLARVMP